MTKGHTLELPPHGFVRYIEHMGTDTSIVEAARVSYGEPSKGDELDRKLIEYLHRNRHTSPFEQAAIKFNIAMPIFCMRQFVRHRTFKLNEFSARYKELPDKFFIPNIWRMQNKTGNKQGSAVTASAADPIWQERQTSRAIHAFSACRGEYEAMIADGVANELARIVIPVSCYTEIYVVCDLHNLMHFLRLRLDKHAQKEMRDIAKSMWEITKQLYPWAAAVFERYRLEMVEAPGWIEAQEA